MSTSQEKPSEAVDKQEESNDKLTKKSGLLRSSGIVSVMTMLSRVLGLVRDVVVASVFGAGGLADAFFVAFKIPNFFRRLFAEGAFSQAFVPVFTEYKAKHGFDELKHLVNAVSGSLTFVLMMMAGICMVGAPVITYIFAPGFHDDPIKQAATADMLRITFPYLVFISMTAMSGAILNSFNRFAVPAFTPVLLNICLICAAFFLTQYMDEPIFALAWGVFIAGLVQMLFQMPFLQQIHLLPRPVWGFGHPGVKKILKLMIPALFGVSVSQISLLLDTVLASFLEDGSVSWLYYSDRLASLPMGVFGIAVATVILPSLSTKHAEASTEAFSNTLEWAMRTVILISMPAMLALLLVAEPLMATIFHYGAITEYDIGQATKSMRAYAFGLLAFMFVKILAPGYFARQDVKTPVKIGIIAMVANMVLNLILIWPLAHVGLALATSLSAWLNAGLLFAGLVKLGLFKAHKRWISYFVKISLANIGLAAVIYLWMEPAQYWFDLSVWQRVTEVGLMVGSGVVTYFVLLGLLGFRLKDFKMSFK